MSILDRLPQTRDGVKVIPGDVVYHPDSISPEYPLVVYAGEDGSLGPEDDGWWVDVPTKRGSDGFICQMIQCVSISECYSVPELAIKQSECSEKFNT